MRQRIVQRLFFTANDGRSLDETGLPANFRAGFFLSLIEHDLLLKEISAADSTGKITAHRVGLPIIFLRASATSGAPQSSPMSPS